MNRVTDDESLSGDEPSERVESLLREEEPAAVEREKTAFDKAVQGSRREIVLFGAGQLGRRTLAGMRQIGQPPVAFADNNPALRGTTIEGVPVYSVADAAARFGHDAAFLVTIWNSRSKDRMSQRMQQLRDQGCEYVVPVGLFFWKYPETFLPYYPLDLPHKALPFANEVRTALQLFGDAESRREFAAQLALRLLMDYDGMGWPKAFDDYAPPDIFDFGPSEVFVDCGAYDGDTIAAFTERQGESFSKIVAFEPDPLNYVRLEKRIQGLPESVGQKIVSFPYALGAVRETVYFNPSGTETSKAGSGPVAVECVPLDEVLQPFAPTLIKFDIEGAEPMALEGARRVISRNRPVLAVSVYHEQAHLWQIPLKMAAMCEDYRFFLRPQGTEGWDLICYAVPTERLSEQGKSGSDR